MQSVRIIDFDTYALNGNSKSVSSLAATPATEEKKQDIVA